MEQKERMNQKNDKSYRVVIVLSTILIFLMACYCNYIWASAYKLEPPTGDPLKEPVVIRTTCYTAKEGSICSTGVQPHSGVIAGPKEWEGMAVMLYEYEYDESGKPIPTRNIGLYTVLDTGAGIDTDGDGKGDSIKRGLSIDVYCETEHEAEEFIDTYGDYTLMILIDGKG